MSAKIEGLSKRVKALITPATSFLSYQKTPMLTLKTILLVFAFVALTACSSKPYVVEPVKTGLATGSKIYEVYVVSYLDHTGFVVPAAEIQARLPGLKERFKSTPYLEFGWGDKAFYPAEQETTNISIPAMFWPTDSAIYVIATPNVSEQYFENVEVRKVCLNNDEYFSLISFISNSFDKGIDGKIIELSSGRYGDSQFYQAVGEYSLLNTCNKWTAKGLKSAGMDISPTFKLTASSVMSYLPDWQSQQITNDPNSSKSISGWRCSNP